MFFVLDIFDFFERRRSLKLWKTELSKEAPSFFYDVMLVHVVCVGSFFSNIKLKINKK